VPDAELLLRPAHELAGLVRGGEVTARELVTASLERIEALDEQVGAFVDVDDARALAILRAAHAFLVEDQRVRAPRTGSIGWCFGGRKSLELALGEPELDAAVMYYGNPIADPAQLAPLKAELLGVFGSRDKSIPPEKVAAFRAALTEAKKVFDIREYDAEHAFANPSNPRYDEVNAGKAWEATRAFLKRTLVR